MSTLRIEHLVSGGIITNYYCSSKCRHCIYGSSPSWTKDYLSYEAAQEIFHQTVRFGCRSLHIGGGEPLLNPEALYEVLRAAQESGVCIEYVETNSSWYDDEKRGREILGRLQEYGVDTLLLSISPFHNEYIPFVRVKKLAEACRQAGIGVFPWITDFIGDIEQFSEQQPHSLEEYAAKFGERYAMELPRRYGLTMGGRALASYEKIMPQVSFEEIMAQSTPCRKLAIAGHFHIDLYGNYIPSGCMGLALDYRDLGVALSDASYPLLNVLYNQGAAGLARMASDEFEFAPRENYLSPCHLCFDVRRFLAERDDHLFRELAPKEFYKRI